jgi:lysophospholipase L1-like esterase
MRVTDTKRNFYAVWLDTPTSKEPTHVIEVKGNDTIINLITSADTKKSKLKEHQVVIQRRTEANCGTTTVREFITDGRFLQAQPLKSRQIEFIGDSYTCGYGVDAPSRRDPFKDETENASRTYASIVARYFDADYVVVAHSGMGAARNYNSKFDGYHMPDRYLQTFDMDSAQATRWNAAESDIRPALTCIYLGGNDFSVSMQPSYEKFRDGYYRLIRYIKDNYGEDYPVLCVSSKAHSTLLDYMRDMVKFCPMPNVYFMACCPALHLSTDEDLGAAMHPNYIGHQKFSYAYIPYIATITGWGLQDMPVK